MGYSLTGNSCADLCSRALSKGGFDPGYSINNHQGKYVYYETKYLSESAHERFQMIMNNNMGQMFHIVKN